MGEELGRKLLASVKQMKAGMGTVVHFPVAQARQASGLSQTQFAGLMGVSVRHPEVLRELASQDTVDA